MKPNL